MTYVPRLVVLDAQGRQEYLLYRPIYSIGRDRQCDIVLRSRFASRYHATLLQHLHQENTYGYEIIDGSYQLVNGELIGKPSANGLLVNGRRQGSHYLGHGDELEIGQVKLFYYLESGGLSIDDDPPSDPNSHVPRNSHPVSPDFGAEAVPDDGLSIIP